MFKKILTLLTLTIAFAGLSSVPALAATDPFEDVCKKGAARNSEVCTNEARTDKTNPVAGDDGVLTSVTNLIALIAGAVAVLVIVIAGLQFILANGDSQKALNARNAIIYAVIGIIVIVLARAIIVFVIDKL